MKEIQISSSVIACNERSNIPDHILPSTRDLITDCWASEPADQPSFDEIVDWMKQMKLKMIPNVYSSKHSAFVTKIEEWEVNNSSFNVIWCEMRTIHVCCDSSLSEESDIQSNLVIQIRRTNTD
jgi:hypothetical protein